ncbi:hypothetical protein LR010_00830 [Candidatus Gracilibacteria bacterium]|nr:hypothetical protein [Candidatus Gracilibacteria bacterium]
MTEKLKNIISGLTDQVGLVDFYIAEAAALLKQDSSFVICDLDDTLFGRKDQMQGEPELKKNRGYAGNTYMINEIGIHEMIRKYYMDTEYPQDILSRLTPEKTLLLTAGIPEYQQLKVRAMHLEKFPLQVVWEGKDKILETIRYVLFELKYIPSEIVIYEDRPHFFIEYKDLIEGVLGTKLTIMYVEMDGNNGYKKIEEI